MPSGAVTRSGPAVRATTAIHHALGRQAQCGRFLRELVEDRRAFGRGKTVYDPWHYVPVLARKPGALRNGAPFKDWELPAPLERVRRKLKSVPDGDRQMVEILSAALLTMNRPVIRDLRG